MVPRRERIRYIFFRILSASFHYIFIAHFAHLKVHSEALLNGNEMQSYTVSEEHFATRESAPSQFLFSAKTSREGKKESGGGEGTLQCLLSCVISDGWDSVILLFL